MKYTTLRGFIKPAAIAFLTLLSTNVLAVNKIPQMKPLPTPPVFSWVGPYAGAFFGNVWGKNNIETDAGNTVGSPYFNTTAAIQSVEQSGTETFKPTSLIGGVEIGNNWKNGFFLYGFELDFGSFALNDDRTVTTNYPGIATTYTFKTSIETHGLFTMRARAGLIPPPVPKSLLYITGGMALTIFEVSNHFIDTNGAFGGENNITRKVGWTVGGGLEIALATHWTINAEYLFTDFGKITAKSSVFTSPLDTTASLTANVLRAALNYKF